MKNTRNPKIALLADRKEKNKQQAAEKSGTILLDKVERREIAGFKARQREIDLIQQPLNADVNEFAAELQERYGIVISVSHNLDFNSCELVPVPEKPSEEPPAM